MKTKLITVIGVISSLFLATSCNEEGVWERYADWRDSNTQYFLEQSQLTNEEGNPFYTSIVPNWNPGARILMKYLNDRTLTQGNLSPLYNSTCQVKYEGKLIDGRVFDNSYNWPDSVITCHPGDMIQGWTIALQFMRVGDHARVIIPYGLGYGHHEMANSIIKPYSTLIFDLTLTNIVDYATK